MAFLGAAAPLTTEAASGGPDLGGYRFIDQAEPGVTFNYVDITATGDLIATGDEDSEPFDLTVGFEFYGTTYDALGVSTNGFLSSADLDNADLSNDCELPDIPSIGGGDFRFAALHDDLIADAFFQYFDAAQATAIGFPGTTDGVSIVQWQGTHFVTGGGGPVVDFEVILFHDTGDILTQVLADGENGSSSTMGLSNGDGTIGLTYGCNDGGFVAPGETAVLFIGGPPPVADCCTESPDADVPGCIDPVCQAAVCAGNAACCSTNWDDSCGTDAATLCTNICSPVSINEILIDQNNADTDEFFELAAAPATELHELSYIVIGDGPGAEPGVIEAVVALDGNTVPASGYFVAAEAGFSLGVPDLVASINLENSDTVTHMVVRSFSGSNGDDLDMDNDGILDVTPWTQVLDTVAVLGGTELPYGPPMSCIEGPFCQNVGDDMNAPGKLQRCQDVDGPWFTGSEDPAADPTHYTPGADNCVCGDGNAVPGEECDGDGAGTGGETALCDLDCTAASCGDGTFNATAGEECDGDNAGVGGETDTCDADCTAAVCGDGTLNTTAGEVCDGDDMGTGGETATCDDDCTEVSCGDGNANTAAGEECDGDGMGTGGETATCDDDCTTAVCGDGLVNNMAGETCDGDGAGMGGETDMCDEDCTAVSCGDGVLNVAAGEMCDGDGAGMGGETDACDPDCTTAACGDGYINEAAGEVCDDMGESEDCNDDCTEASCGDGVVNAAAGEDCDDEGESEDCNDDCTAASCGDSVVNAAAGETCDDGEESETCNDDCTDAVCGDGVLNTTAGEECDDDNTDDGDGCAADCTEESGGTTGGDTGDTGADDTGETGVDDTAGDDTAGDDTTGDGTTGGASVTVGETVGMTNGGDDSTGGEGDTDTDSSGGAIPSDDGCSCSSDGRDTPWGLFALFGIGALRRRRRS